MIFCSGKHFYALHQHRLKQNYAKDEIAIIRLEELCPFPATEINALLTALKTNVLLIWAQEEPCNMGAWSFIETRFRNMFGKQVRFNVFVMLKLICNTVAVFGVNFISL